MLVVLFSWGWFIELKSRRWAAWFLGALGVLALFNAAYFIMAQGKLKSTPKPPIRIYHLLLYVIIPLIVSAVLSCWLFSIDPISRTGDVVVKDGIITQEEPGGSVFQADPSYYFVDAFSRAWATRPGCAIQSTRFPQRPSSERQQR